MLVVQLLILSLLLIVLPFFVGGIFSVVERGHGKRMFQWISGQFLIWVGIELIAVALILKRDSLEKAMVLFWWYIAAMSCFALGTLIRQWVCGKKLYIRADRNSPKGSVQCKILWCIFSGILVFQLAWMIKDYYAVAMYEADSPFYVTSPFSMWIAFLARSSGMHPKMIEQMVLPIVFLCMSYGVFYLLGAKLLTGKREYPPLFLMILSLVAIALELVYKKYEVVFLPVGVSKTEMMMLGCVLFPYLIFLLVLFGKIMRKKEITS